MSVVTFVDVPNPNLVKLSDEALAWRSFGTIGYDAYVQWVLQGEETHPEPEVKPS